MLLFGGGGGNPAAAPQVAASPVVSAPESASVNAPSNIVAVAEAPRGTAAKMSAFGGSSVMIMLFIACFSVFF